MPPNRNSSISRKQLVRACKARGWVLHPTALEGMETYLSVIVAMSTTTTTTTSLDRHWHEILDVLATHMAQCRSTAVTPALWQQVAQILEQRHLGSNANPLSSDSARNNNNNNDNNNRFWRERLDNHNNHDDDDDNEEALPSLGHHHIMPRVHVVSAFETPRLTYDAMRRQFGILSSHSKPMLVGTAQDKIDVLAQRFLLIQQRILRHELFRPRDLQSRHHHSNKLTPIESLLGQRASSSSASSSYLLLGLLLQIEQGRYYLEDSTGQVPIVFAIEQQPASSSSLMESMITEHCILLVEGRFVDDVLHVHRWGHPLPESRATSLRAIQQQVRHSWFSSPSTNSLSLSNRQDRRISRSPSFVILSDVHLDHPRVLQQLEALFTAYEKVPLHELPLFVLMGDFCSSSSSSSQSYAHTQQRTQLLEELLTLISKNTNVAHHAHFCIVPGPRDVSVLLGQGSTPILPFPPLDVCLSSDHRTKSLVKHVHWGSNPCRIRWGNDNSEMLIFRYDLLQLFHQEQLWMPTNTTTTTTSVSTSRRTGALSTNPGEPPSSSSSRAAGTTLSQQGVDPMMTEHDDNDSELGPLHPMPPPHSRLVKTILDQGHLLPVAGVPVYWNYDHALRLYPLPDLVVLGGDSLCGGHESRRHHGHDRDRDGTSSSSSAAFFEMYHDCQVLHPGSLVQDSQYAVWTPDGVLADSDDDDILNENQTMPRVQFVQLGQHAASTNRS